MKICFPTSEHFAGNGYRDTEKLSLVGFRLHSFFYAHFDEKPEQQEKTCKKFLQLRKVEKYRYR